MHACTCDEAGKRPSVIINFVHYNYTYCRVYFRISLKEGQMLSTKIKGGLGLSTNYVIRSTKNPKGGGAKAPPGPPLK